MPPSQSSRRVKQTKLYSSELKVSNLLLYPDFEPLFELFEPLQSMQVSEAAQLRCKRCGRCGPTWMDLTSACFLLWGLPVQVRFVVEGAPSPEVATMLLSGYAMPVQAKAPDTGGEAEAA